MGGVFHYKNEDIGEFVLNRQEFRGTGRRQSKKRKGLGVLQSRMREDSCLEGLLLGEMWRMTGK